MTRRAEIERRRLSDSVGARTVEVSERVRMNGFPGRWSVQFQVGAVTSDKGQHARYRVEAERLAMVVQMALIDDKKRRDEEGTK